LDAIDEIRGTSLESITKKIENKNYFSIEESSRIIDLLLQNDNTISNSYNKNKKH
jgi:hypothetical protein